MFHGGRDVHHNVFINLQFFYLKKNLLYIKQVRYQLLYSALFLFFFHFLWFLCLLYCTGWYISLVHLNFTWFFGGWCFVQQHTHAQIKHIWSFFRLSLLCGYLHCTVKETAVCKSIFWWKNISQSHLFRMGCIDSELLPFIFRKTK